MVTKVAPAIRRLVQRFPNVFPNGMADVKLCMDSAPWHQQAVRNGMFEAMGLERTQQIFHPPRSPDFQAPIEWSHSWLNQAMTKYLEEHPRLSSDKAVCTVMKSLFFGQNGFKQYEVVTAQKVAAAFKSLERNYEAIISAKGGYGMKRST